MSNITSAFFAIKPLAFLLVRCYTLSVKYNKGKEDPNMWGWVKRFF